MIPPLAIFLCFAVVVCAICAVWFILDARACNRERPHGKHARLFADPADTADPDGSIWLRALHHIEPPDPDSPRPTSFARAGEVPLPPLPEGVTAADIERVRDEIAARPADTAPLPVVICELGMPTEEYIDGLFAKYAEVTS